MVDYTIIITVASSAIAIIWGVFSIKQIIKQSAEKRDDRLLMAIDTRLGVVKTQIEKNEELFLTDKNEKERLILTLKDDIHVLEQHLQDLCNSVSKHDGILQSVNPVIIAVQNQVTELKIKVELMEKDITR